MKWIFRDFWWKLFSLVIAFGLWFAMVGDQERATTLNVPVEMKGIPTEFEISSDAPERVTLEVQGPSSKVRDLSESRVSVILDLSSVSEPGQRTFTLDQSNVFLPMGVRLNRAVPAQIRMRFETRMSKEVPVRVNLASPPPEGYRVLSEVVSPQLVRIEGPSSRVVKVSEAETDPIDISNVVGEKEFRVNLYVNDPMIRLANVTGVIVRIYVGLDPGPDAEAKPKK
ncbi:MAG: CdaR family protein [Bryobacterales bacterium]|nr:CdaR family protein [Bryobacterales bacterium]